MPTDHDPVALVALRDEPLSVDEVLDAVRHPSVRWHRPVRRRRARPRPRRVRHGARLRGAPERRRHHARAPATTSLGRSQAVRVAAVHRTGALQVGDLAVVVAAAAPHRGQAFDACRDLIDTLKAETPIWKHQSLGDGSTEWVGLP